MSWTTWQKFRKNWTKVFGCGSNMDTEFYHNLRRWSVNFTFRYVGFLWNDPLTWSKCCLAFSEMDYFQWLFHIRYLRNHEYRSMITGPRSGIQICFLKCFLAII
jgi:hypothetical protein